ncbi:MAG: hypothetical protein ABW175_22370 [Bradyrhizobium sp.]
MNVTKMLGYAAVGGLLMLAVPVERAQAVSLIGPGAAAAVVQDGPSDLTTEVRWRHHGWRRHHHRHHHRHWRRW